MRLLISMAVFFVSIVAFCLLVCTASFLDIFKFLAEMIGFV